MEEKSNLDYICLNQFIRHKYYIPMEGVGDCRYCMPDKDNIKCKLYQPIPIYRIIKEE